MSPSVHVDSFIRFFADHLVKLDSHYNWPVRLKRRKPYLTFPGMNGKCSQVVPGECIALKKYLTQTWNTSDEVDKKALARWIVADWGGVRSNRAATFDAHWQLIQLDVKQIPLQGIASYSKILTLKDCTQYAIYDARVAACLNAVQLQMKPEQPVFFPYIPSQNQHFRQWPKRENFVNVFPRRKLVEDRGWFELTKDETYATYLNLLHTLKKSFPGKEIYHFEMSLFSLSTRLCPQLVTLELTEENESK